MIGPMLWQRSDVTRVPYIILIFFVDYRSFLIRSSLFIFLSCNSYQYTVVNWIFISLNFSQILNWKLGILYELYNKDISLTTKNEGY